MLNNKRKADKTIEQLTEKKENTSETPELNTSADETKIKIKKEKKKPKPQHKSDNCEDLNIDLNEESTHEKTFIKSGNDKKKQPDKVRHCLNFYRAIYQLQISSCQKLKVI